MSLLPVVVFNIKSQEARIVHLTPNDTWGGAGLLGVTIRLDNYAGAEDRFIRVLSVVENGPAAVSGLLNDGTDFILGTTHHTINSLSHFAQLLQNSIDRIVELYVYNSNTDIVRVVTLMPSYEWNTKSGGTGLFGAEVGTGYLHRLPYKSRSTSGKCVERQVRYVTATSEANKNVVLLEDAPQMEMEPPDREDDDDENAEEVYSEPHRERKSVPVSQELPVEQVSGSGTAENVEPVWAQASHEPDTNVAASSNESLRPALDQSPRLPSPAPPQIQSNTTAAAAAIFGQPLVPPPLHHNQPPSITASQTSTVPPSVVAPLGPPPLSYYGASSSSFAPPAVSYAPPSTTQQPQQSYYYGGQPQTSTTATGGSFSYAPPATTAMMPPPPVGGVWNQSTSSNQ